MKVEKINDDKKMREEIDELRERERENQTEMVKMQKKCQELMLEV